MFERFQQYLIKNGSIGSKQIPYYIKWVMDCYAVLDCQPDTIISNESSSRPNHRHGKVVGRGARKHGKGAAPETHGSQY